MAKRHRQALSVTADLYAETEIAAVALLECSHRLDASAAPGRSDSWGWRWVLPALPPPFLCRQRYFYEALYSAIKARWWIRTVDALADASVVEGTAGLLLGTIAALGIVDDRLSAAFTVTQLDARGVLAAATGGLLLLLWLGVKLTARRAVTGTVWVSVGALLLALAITWILPSPAPTPAALLPVIGLRWLIIDAVAFTADRSGLLRVTSMPRTKDTLRPKAQVLGEDRRQQAIGSGFPPRAPWHRMRQSSVFPSSLLAGPTCSRSRRAATLL